MATLAFTESAALKNQGIRATKPIEWIKITANASTTGQGAAYSFKTIKACDGVVGAGPFAVAIDNSAKTVTFTPLITTTGVY